ncbi:alpha/beta hydrolase family protein [Inhella proteolytica]|uniref:S9 family peptidase n=1 Tax=Inhella proteolytica TaxID=2795029 RepID=A0A931J0V0_9BURK|nr:alpha/beta fold hydrolase [Inhella proteolytica]MBH9576653.1 S9 family peptidase [Inhella proteolytica]
MAWVQAATGLPAELFFKESELRQAVLSPSGTKLALSFGGDGRRVGLFVLEVDDTSKGHAVAHFSDVDVNDIHWVNDERLIFSTTDFSAGGGRPSGAPGLFAVDASGENLRMLVRRRHAPMQTGTHIVSRTLDWNHELLMVPQPRAAETNEEVLIAELKFGLDDSVSYYPLWLHTRTGRTRGAEVRAPGEPLRWWFDGQGEARAVMTRKDQYLTLHWRAPGQTEWQVLASGDVLRMPFLPHSVDDKGQLYVTHGEGPEGRTVLSLYDFASKAPGKVLVSLQGFDFQGRLLRGAPGERALGLRLTHDAETTIWFSAAHKQLQQKVDAQLPGRVNRMSCRRCDGKDVVALIHSYADVEAGRVWLYRGSPPQGQTEWTAVAAARKELQPAEMATLDLHRIRARDGHELPVWVSTPRRPAAGKPAVVLVHGGPWVRGWSWTWETWTQFLASRGYLVIAPEFRGSSGYGDAHERAGYKQWGRAMQDDVADALQWARKQGLAGEKACIAGASYGGYSALMGLVRHPELYRCGVAWVAVTDLELLLNGSVWIDDDTSDLARRHSLPEMIGDPVRDAEMLRAHSPVHQAARIQVPVLLGFGEDDRRVPLAHGQRLRAALQKAGNEPEWVSYPGEGHFWALLKNRVDFAQRVERFLERHLQ